MKRRTLVIHLLFVTTFLGLWLIGQVSNINTMAPMLLLVTMYLIACGMLFKPDRKALKQHWFQRNSSLQLEINKVLFWGAHILILLLFVKTAWILFRSEAYERVLVLLLMVAIQTFLQIMIFKHAYGITKIANFVLLTTVTLLLPFDVFGGEALSSTLLLQLLLLVTQLILLTFLQSEVRRIRGNVEQGRNWYDDT